MCTTVIVAGLNVLQALADEYGLRFFETSAKGSDKVEEAFLTISRDVMQRLMQSGQGSGGKATSNIKVSQRGKESGGKSGGCC